MGDGYLAAGKQGFDRVMSVMRPDVFHVLVVIDASFVTQLAVLIEDKYMGRCDCPEFLYGRLSLPVIQIGPRNLLVFHTNFHVTGSIREIGISELIEPNSRRIVGVYGDERYTFVMEFVVQRAHARL